MNLPGRAGRPGRAAFDGDVSTYQLAAAVAAAVCDEVLKRRGLTPEAEDWRVALLASAEALNFADDIEQMVQRFRKQLEQMERAL